MNTHEAEILGQLEDLILKVRNGETVADIYAAIQANEQDKTQKFLDAAESDAEKKAALVKYSEIPLDDPTYEVAKAAHRLVAELKEKLNQIK